MSIQEGDVIPSMTRAKNSWNHVALNTDDVTKEREPRRVQKKKNGGEWGGGGKKLGAKKIDEGPKGTRMLRVVLAVWHNTLVWGIFFAENKKNTGQRTTK